jgi:low affinity Fe/Cu permease
MRPSKAHRWFEILAKRVARQAGQPSAFALAVGVILVWLAVGPVFGFSDSWQLFVNTGTTIVTFLMVFLVQSTQNRDGEAIQVKLDELIRATAGAHNGLLDLEEMEERELDAIRRRYVDLARRARDERGKGELDTGVPDVSG